MVSITIPATDAAREWAGWGTALKPAIEDWWVFRKPLSEGTVAANVLRWGTGALAIDACRINGEIGPDRANGKPRRTDNTKYGKANPVINPQSPLGRFPANLITDGSDEVRAMFPQTTNKGHFPKSRGNGSGTSMFGLDNGEQDESFLSDTGSAARFFAVCPLDEGDYPPLYYCAKASKAERDAGCEDLPVIHVKMNNGNDAGGDPVSDRFTKQARNHHPTVKSLSLMRYLITLCTRPGATVLDPFCGSGSTLVACVQLGRNGIGCDNNAEYIEIAKARVKAAMPIEVELPLFDYDVLSD